MTDESIAIVGASCRFPGAENLGKFWQLLVSAGDAVSEVDDRRWSTRLYYHPDRGEPGKSYTWSAGLRPDHSSIEPRHRRSAVKEGRGGRYVQVSLQTQNLAGVVTQWPGSLRHARAICDSIAR